MKTTNTAHGRIRVDDAKAQMTRRAKIRAAVTLGEIPAALRMTHKVAVFLGAVFSSLAFAISNYQASLSRAFIGVGESRSKADAVRVAECFGSAHSQCFRKWGSIRGKTSLLGLQCICGCGEFLGPIQ